MFCNFPFVFNLKYSLIKLYVRIAPSRIANENCNAFNYDSNTRSISLEFREPVKVRIESRFCIYVVSYLLSVKFLWTGGRVCFREIKLPREALNNYIGISCSNHKWQFIFGVLYK